MITIKKIIKKIYKIFFKETPSERFNREEQENYQKWIDNNEPDEIELEKQSKTSFSYMPKISIVIPLYNTPKKFFKELIASIDGQTYANWELCFADGSEKESEFVKETIGLYGEKIRYKFIGFNKGISGNTNDALELATGDYIALMDQDDLLPKFALYEIVKAINDNKDVNFIYSDEDKIYDDGDKKVRTSPHFKQDFALDTLRSYNYICHFSIFSRKLINKIGQLNSEFDGSQDYDFILRATENADKIVHIPKVLYNWRISKSSVASGSKAKPYAYEAAKKVLLSSLKRNNINGAKVEDSRILGLYKVTYPIKNNEKISIIITNKNNQKQLEKCINSVLKSSYENYEIIIVDNNSNEQSVLTYYKKLNKNNKIRIEYVGNQELNYSEINNFGASKSTGEFLVFLGSNTEIYSKDWLDNIVGNCQRPEVGCIGAKILNKNNRIEHVGITLNLMGLFGYTNRFEKNNNPGYFGRIMIQQNVMAVSGQLLGISKEVFNKVKGFDNSFTGIYSDIDLCLKINDIEKAVIYNPYIVAYNNKYKFEHIDSEDKKMKEKWKKYFNKEDKYFNPNFRKDVPNMRINPQKIQLREVIK